MRKASIATICILLALVFTGQALHGHCCPDDVGCLISTFAAEEHGQECADGEVEHEKILLLLKLSQAQIPQSDTFLIHGEDPLITASSDILSPPPKG